MGRRAALLRMLGLLPATRYGSMGQMHRRPDQQTDAPSSAVAPSQAAGILRARTVIISGSGPHIGLFVYNGTVAKGNLVGEITPPGVTSDGPGNSIPSSGVLNIGTWNGSGTLTSHFGVNNVGDVFLVNTAGKTILHARSSDGSLFFYNTSGEGLNNLTESIAPASGTDPPGNTSYAGIVTYSTNAIVQLFGGVMNVGIPNQIAGGGGAIPGKVGLNLANTAAIVEINSGETASGDVQSLLDVESANASGFTGGLVSATTGKLQVVLPDGNTYRTERLDQVLGGVGFTINSTTPQAIFTQALGTGVYLIDVWAVTSNATAADAAGYAWAFTGTAAAPLLLDYESKTTGTAVVGYLASATLTTQFNGQGTGGNQQLLARLTVNVSVAGTLTFTGKQLVALNNITVFAGARMSIRPQ